MDHNRARRTGWCGRGSGGSVLVEAVVALPVALLLILGTIEGGIMMKTYSTTSSAVRSGARVASVAGADPMADQRILARIRQEASGGRPMSVRKVVIWHALGPGDPLPEACDLSPGTEPSTVSLGVSDGGVDAMGACNVYLNPDLAGGAFDMASGEAPDPPSHYFACQGPSDPDAGQKVDCRWPGKDRRVLTGSRSGSGAVSSPDFVGVYMEVEHRLASGVVLRAVTLRETAISLIEPQGYDLQ